MGGVTASVVSAQQLGAQNNIMLSFIRENAQVAQELVNIISQSSPSGGRGQNVDLTI